jgi:hypothetical protein
MMEELSMEEAEELLGYQNLASEARAGNIGKIWASGPIVIVEACTEIQKCTRFYAKEERGEDGKTRYSYIHVTTRLSGEECRAVIQGLINAWNSGKSVGVRVGQKIATDAICRLIKSIPAEQS